jgi:hypothetical protein
VLKKSRSGSIRISTGKTFGRRPFYPFPVEISKTERTRMAALRVLIESISSRQAVLGRRNRPPLDCGEMYVTNFTSSGAAQEWGMAAERWRRTLLGDQRARTSVFFRFWPVEAKSHDGFPAVAEVFAHSLRQDCSEVSVIQNKVASSMENGVP